MSDAQPFDVYSVVESSRYVGDFFLHEYFHIDCFMSAILVFIINNIVHSVNITSQNLDPSIE